MCYIVTMCHQWFCMNKWLSLKYTLVENTIVKIYSRWISSRSRSNFSRLNFLVVRNIRFRLRPGPDNPPHPWVLQILSRYNWIHCGPCMCYIFEKSLVQEPQKQCSWVSDMQIHKYTNTQRQFPE